MQKGNVFINYRKIRKRSEKRLGFITGFIQLIKGRYKWKQKSYYGLLAKITLTTKGKMKLR